jgi:hypothetical protein
MASCGRSLIGLLAMQQTFQEDAILPTLARSYSSTAGDQRLGAKFASLPCRLPRYIAKEHDALFSESVCGAGRRQDRPPHPCGTVGRKAMRLLFLSLLFLAPASAGDQQFNGRWNIKVVNEPKNRAWWLEVDGAGGGPLKGRFVGFPGGNTDDIPQISIHDGELTFSADRNKQHLVYHARLKGDKLEGTFE